MPAVDMSADHTFTNHYQFRDNSKHIIEFAKERANCQEKGGIAKKKRVYTGVKWLLCAAECQLDSSVSYLYVERNADEDIPTYRDDDSQEIGLWKHRQTVNTERIRRCSTCHTTVRGIP